MNRLLVACLIACLIASMGCLGFFVVSQDQITRQAQKPIAGEWVGRLYPTTLYSTDGTEVGTAVVFEQLNPYTTDEMLNPQDRINKSALLVDRSGNPIATVDRRLFNVVVRVRGGMSSSRQNPVLNGKEVRFEPAAYEWGTGWYRFQWLFAESVERR
jgi:hypothetical protein